MGFFLTILDPTHEPSIRHCYILVKRGEIMAKIEIVQVQGNSFYCNGKNAVGVIVNPQTNAAILIDSGLDDTTAKQIDYALNEHRFVIKAIINTHSHADHCGGNAYFQKKYPNLAIYATSWEKPFIENCFLEPSTFTAAAQPFSDLRNKFLEAANSHVTHVLDFQEHSLEIEGIPLRIIPLPGHSYGMVGVATADKVLYSGDALFGNETLEKHGMLYYTNIADTLESLYKVQKISQESFTTVLYHGGPQDKLALFSLIEKHVQIINGISEVILKKLEDQTSISFELLLSEMIVENKVPENTIQYFLTKTCLNAYLSNLQAKYQIILEIQNGHLIVKRS
jgi:glyoxylase-like metal-dependent hydrolase (beta-lactamase superfamily II)